MGIEHHVQQWTWLSPDGLGAARRRQTGAEVQILRSAAPDADRRLVQGLSRTDHLRPCPEQPASRGPRARTHDRGGDRRMAGTALKPLILNTEPEYADIQGLVRFAHARLTEACFLLLRIADRRAAGAWLAAAPVTN